MFGKRFNEISYYERLSSELAKSIEIYENSCEVFNSYVVERKKGDLTAEQKQIVEEFVEFCKREGLQKGNQMSLNRFNGLKKIIEDRVSLMKERKESIDAHLAVLKEFDSFENGEISEAKKEELRKEAEKKYEEGTTKYSKYLLSITQDYVASEKERLHASAADTRKKADAVAKKNSFGSVILSTLGPLGNPIYNAVATVHNANAKLRNNHKIINLSVKLAMVAGTALFASALPFSPLLAVSSFGVTAVSLINTVRHAFKTTKIDPMTKKTTVGGYLNNIKNTWFKYRKSHGKGKIETDSFLYQKIDIANLLATTTSNEKGEGKTNVSSKEQTATKETKAENTEEQTISMPSVEQPKEEQTASVPSVEQPTVEETNNEEQTLNMSDVEQPKEEQTVSVPSVEQPTVEETNNEERTLNMSDVEQPKEEQTEEKQTDTITSDADYNVEINSLTDVLKFMSVLENQAGRLQSVNDYYALRNSGEYLNRLLDNLGKTKGSSPKDEITFQRVLKIRNILENKITNGNTFGNIPYKKIAEDSRNKAYKEIVAIVGDSSIENYENQVEFYVRHYLFTDEQKTLLNMLIQQRKNRETGRQR